MRQVVVVSFSLALFCASPAHAEPSVRERIYARNLSLNLHLPHAPPERVELGDAVGVCVPLPGIEVERYRFPTAAAALEFTRLDQGRVRARPLVVEARGRQVVILSGRLLADARFAKPALESAWRILPGGSAERGYLGVVDPSGNVAGHAVSPGSSAHAALMTVIEQAQTSPEADRYQEVRPGTWAHQGERGLLVVFDRQGGFARCGDSVEELAALASYLGRLAGQDLGLDPAVERLARDLARAGHGMAAGPRLTTIPAGWDRDLAVDPASVPTSAPGRGLGPLESGARIVSIPDVGLPQAEIEHAVEPSAGRIDLSGIWSVPAPDGSATPANVLLSDRRAGARDDTYTLTLVSSGEAVDVARLTATFDGETLTTEQVAAEPERCDLAGEHRGFVGVLAGEQRVEELPAVEPDAERAEPRHGSYVLQRGARVLAFEARSALDPQSATPVERFERLREPDVVCPAEWEPAEEILWGAPVAGDSFWIKNVYAAALRSTPGVDHLIFVSSEDDLLYLDFELSLAVGELSSVAYVVQGPGGVWIRDYGPIVCRRKRDGSRIVGDTGYYGNRPRGDQIPAEYARLRGWALRDVNELKIEGGNFMSDGQGRVFTTDETLAANDSQEQVEERLFALGAREVAWFEPLGEPDGTGHIDMFAKLTGPDSVLVSVAGDGPHAAVLERNAARFSALGYAVTRIPVGDSPSLKGSPSLRLKQLDRMQTYTNALFVGRIALVPQYGDPVQDAEALVIYRRAGYTPVGIDSRILITANGAIHCVSMQVPR